ncbi:hypothetical protein CPAV1605_1058 [seawater metagenome]|uniref:Uncharacterized protein n=1 Tax=seawater metagenome TaxID=1561972 RepID=A0A5E8CJT7_9ZZZZ
MKNDNNNNNEIKRQFDPMTLIPIILFAIVSYTHSKNLIIGTLLRNPVFLKLGAQKLLAHALVFGIILYIINYAIGNNDQPGQIFASSSMYIIACVVGYAIFSGLPIKGISVGPLLIFIALYLNLFARIQ